MSSASPSRPDADPAGDAPASGLFTGGEYGQALQTLRQTALIPGSTVLVTGPHGVGKSTLCRAFAMSLDTRFRTFRLNGALLRDPAELQAALIRTLDLALPPGTDTSTVAAQSLADAIHAGGADRPALILIDDADLLDHDALALLGELAARAAIVLILFGRPRLAAMLGRAGPVDNRLELKLTGLDPADVAGYLAWRKDNGRPDGAGVPDPVALGRRTHGLPGRIEALLDARGPAPAVLLRRPGTALGALAALAAIGLLAALIHALYDQGPSPAVAPPIEPPIEPPIAPPIAPPIEPPIEPPIAPPIGPGTVTAAPGPVQPESAADTADGSLDPVAEPGVEPLVEPVTEPVVASTPEPAAVAAPDAPVQREPATSGSTVVTPPKPAPEAPAPSVPPPASVPAVAAPDAPARAATPESTTDAGRDWLRRQPPDHFTLQIAVVSSADRARAFVRAQGEQSGYVTYAVAGPDAVRHVIVQGAYPTRAAAEAAAAGLARPAGGSAPWIRRFAELQQALGAE